MRTQQAPTKALEQEPAEPTPLSIRETLPILVAGHIGVRKAAAAALLCLIFSGCSSPEEPIRAIEANIETMETALKEGDSGDLTQFLAASFAGGRAGKLNLNKDDVRNMMRGYSLRYKHLQVLLSRVSVELDEKEPALAYMNGTVAVSGANRLLPSTGGVYKISGEWQNFDGDWKLRRLNWD